MEKGFANVGKAEELKGLLSETLGDLPFKFAIVVVVFFSFLYTFYDAYFANRISNVIKNDCHCDHADRAFYRTVVLISIVLWVCFLFGYAVISTFGHGHFLHHSEAKVNRQ